jgi:hypothetical protein
MAALPLTQKGLDANLPAESREATGARPEVSQFVLDYSAAREISVKREVVKLSDLEVWLRSIYDQLVTDVRRKAASASD